MKFDESVSRLNTQKLVYDGKRVQPIYERKVFDYSSAVIFEEFGLYEPLSTAPYLDLSSQNLNIPPGITKDYLPTKFVQMCINKIRSPVNTISWCPDGRRLLSASNSGEITLWNGASFNFDTILQAHSYPIKSMCWSHNLKLLITADSNGIVKYWNESMNNLQVIEVHNECIKDLSFSHNDAKFLTASDDSTIKIIDTLSCKIERTLNGHNWDVKKAQFHNKLALIASGGKDNLLNLWDPRVEKALNTFHYHKNTILSLKFYKENFLISGGKDQVIKILDLRNMKNTFTYRTDGDITSLFCSKDYIISGDNKGEIVYWEGFNPNYISKCNEKHDNIIWSLDLHPLQHVLASGGADFQVKFFVRPRPEDFVEKEKEEVESNEINEGEGFIPGL